MDNVNQGKRLDVALVNLLQISREKVKTTIIHGNVTVNGKIITKPSYILQENDVFDVKIEPIQQYKTLKPNFDIMLDVVYEDNYLLVIEKPSGIAVHPGSGEDFYTIANALTAKYGEDFCDQTPLRPGIVHRIDKNTSGLLLIAKTNEMQNILSQIISNREIKREYLALIYGKMRVKFKTIDANIGDDPRHHERKRISIVGGKPAITHAEELWSDGESSIVKCKLETGRTHQIRIHMAHIGHGIVGDTVYALKPPSFFAKIKSGAIFSTITRQMLHAASLEFTHPRTKENMRFESKYYQKLLTNSHEFINTLLE